MTTFNPRNFTNNASGNLNKKYKQQYKQIDMDDLDVEMISPQFLQTKTLKKPLQEYDISLSKTNPQGISHISQIRDAPTSDHRSAVIFQKEQPKSKKNTSSISVIDASSLNIKPAYKAQSLTKAVIPQSNQTSLSLPKDNNTILAALMKKGIKPQTVIQPQKILPKEERKVGPAENKLKAMMNKGSSVSIEVSGPKASVKKPFSKPQDDTDQIGEDIMEEYDSYGNESFEKMSGASVIKQSIAGQSLIKESIRQSIRQSIRDSIHQSLPNSTGQIKQSIREDIKQSIANSSKSLREQIIEEISNSKGKQESIEEQYQQVFQDIEASNSLSKSRSGFKKSHNKKDFDQLSASKSFRMKTNVVKTLKLAQQLNRKQREDIIPKKLDDPMLKDQIVKQKMNIKRLQENMTKFFTRQIQPNIRQQKHKDLYYHFKIELNKLISSGNFQSKLKKLASFLAIPNSQGPNQSKLNELEDGILKNVMNQIQNIRVGRYQIDQVQRIRQEYQQKLKQQMLKQQVTLRAQMNQKLSEKDMELKKMIAELQSRMMSRSFYKGGQGDVSHRAQQYQVESDYSIDSDNVSWKADLWELLPQYEKKKLYDKQSAQVTKFLADVMINELQQQALDRSLDISFEFPQEYNNIPVNYTITERSNESSFSKSNYSEKSSFSKPNQNKVQKESKSSQGFLSDLPKLNIKRSNYSESSNSSKQYQEIKSERIKKDEKIKTQIIKILSQYKALYIRKKQDAIRNLLRVIQTKDPQTKKHMLSSISQLSILTQRQYRKDHKMYIKAYEEELFMSLLGIYNRSLNKKQVALEQQMKKIYDRLVVVSQVSIAEKCTERVGLDVEKNMKYNVEVLTKQAIQQMEQHPCVIDIATHQNYMELKTKTEQKQIKNDVVQHIVNILTTEFAKQFPKKKK